MKIPVLLPEQPDQTVLSDKPAALMTDSNTGKHFVVQTVKGGSEYAAKTRHWRWSQVSQTQRWFHPTRTRRSSRSDSVVILVSPAELLFVLFSIQGYLGTCKMRQSNLSQTGQS